MGLTERRVMRLHVRVYLPLGPPRFNRDRQDMAQAIGVARATGMPWKTIRRTLGATDDAENNSSRRAPRTTVDLFLRICSVT